MDHKIVSNTDHVGRRSFQIIRHSRNAPTEIEFGGKKIKLGRSGAATVSDMEWARDFNAVHGLAKSGDKKYMVIPTEKPEDPTHRRTFRVRLPAGYKREAQKFGG